MSKEQVVSLMKSSKTIKEFNNNAEKVKAYFGGDYPFFWHEAIFLSGVLDALSENLTKK